MKILFDMNIEGGGAPLPAEEPVKIVEEETEEQEEEVSSFRGFGLGK